MQNTGNNKNTNENGTPQPNENNNRGNKHRSTVSRIRTAPVRLADASNQPEHEPLLGDMIQTGKITIVFSDTGVGKSIFVTQLADALSKGTKEILGMPSIGKPLNVLLYDNELTDAEFHERYHRANLQPNFYIANKLELTKSGDLDIDKMVNDITLTGAQVLIIDNITSASMEALTDTDAGMKIMRNVVEVKKMLGVALVIVAHIPKAQAYQVLTVNHLGGSKMLSNFSDSVIGIGRTTSGFNQRYLKHIKSRSKPEKPEVVLVELVSEPGNLHFKKVGITEESKAIDKAKDSAEDAKIERAREMLAEGKSYDEISKELGIPKSTLHRKLKKGDKE